MTTWSRHKADVPGTVPPEKSESSRRLAALLPGAPSFDPSSTKVGCGRRAAAAARPTWMKRPASIWQLLMEGAEPERNILNLGDHLGGAVHNEFDRARFRCPLAVVERQHAHRIVR
jgi:hypothetical protein